MAHLAADPRVERYARLLVERCLDVQPGWQVLVRSTPLARPLVEAVQGAIAERGAYAVVRLNWSLWPTDVVWAAEAPLDLVGELPDIDRAACELMDARITVEAPENTRQGSDLDPERRALVRRRERAFYRRTMAMEIPWVSCQFPTQALAQEAGLTLPELEEVLYAACLRDWDAERERLLRYLQLFDAAEEVRIVGPGTDLRLSLSGRRGEVDDGRTNLPGGEIFFAPVEDSAEGTIVFGECPAVYDGHELRGVRLRFQAGQVVEASAATGEEALLAALERDPGARRLGELGIGLNPGVARPMRNVLFDEKMEGSIHLALGQSYSFLGGTNVSAIHWDLVKDLRQGGRIELDGRVVQAEGRWLL